MCNADTFAVGKQKCIDTQYPLLARFVCVNYPMKEKLVYKKSWVAYVPYTIIFLLALSLFPYHGFFSKICGILLLVPVIMRILRIATVTWTLSEEAILIESGLLPWQKHEHYIAIYDIYECLTHTGFLGHFLNYGDVAVRKNDGTNSAYTGTKLNGAQDLSQRINSLVHEHKKNGNPTVTNYNVIVNSVSIELERLSSLLHAGKLSQEEYDVLKQRIIEKE